MSTPGLLIAAPSSGAGKTTITLALLAALRRNGIDVRAAKSGPDYIDTAFHAVASGHASVNLDPWAMDADTIRHRAIRQEGELLLVEAAMGVLDGAADGTGSACDLARMLGLPVILVLDVARQSRSALLAPLGFRQACPDLDLAGIILTRTGSDRHAAMVRDALEGHGFNVLGHIPRTPELALPERHLGLVQAAEADGLDGWLDTAASHIATNIDLYHLQEAARPIRNPHTALHPIPPLGSRIAIAQDVAFSFAYPHLLADWHQAGASLHPFSPLQNGIPDPSADAIFLPGGYPELHAGRLAEADQTFAALRQAAKSRVVIYGECGGYMTLGDALVDATGQAHPMAGLLPVTTSFAKRKLSLGYRRLTPLAQEPFTTPLLGHEFHYSTITAATTAPALFTAKDASGVDLGQIGHHVGTVSGSYAHIIAPAI